MINNYHIISISHQTLDVRDIGQFALQHSDTCSVDQQLELIKEKFQLEELQYLNTCNRMEFIFFTSSEIDSDFFHRFFKEVNPTLSDTVIQKIDSFVSHYSGEQAISHILEVSSSLDSLVVGEREIFRQYRQSYTRSENLDIVGPKLRMLEKSVVVAAKEVYAKTKIGEKSLSIVALAIEELLLRKPDRSSKVLLIGAGETNALMLKFLIKKGYHNVRVYNRTLDNAAKLSEKYNVEAAHLGELPKYNDGFDIIIACTGATSAVLTEDIYKNILNRDKQNKLIIDLAVPRNVEEAIVDLHNVTYVAIDHLRERAAVNLESRKEEIVDAKLILKKHLVAFVKEYQQRQIQKVLTSVPKEVKAIKEKALNQRFKKDIDGLDPQAQELIHSMMDYMEKSFVAVPMKLAKESVA